MSKFGPTLRIQCMGWFGEAVKLLEFNIINSYQPHTNLNHLKSGIILTEDRQNQGYSNLPSHADVTAQNTRETLKFQDTV